jgi:hypothetical protein
MPTYRLVFAEEPKGGPTRSVCFTADNAGQALILAQQRECPAELWLGERHLCTLSRSGDSSHFWIIS